VTNGDGSSTRLVDLVVDLSTGDYPMVTGVLVPGEGPGPYVLPAPTRLDRHEVRVPDGTRADPVAEERLAQMVLLRRDILDALVLAPCDRSAIWLAKGVATFVFLALAEVVALPAFALFFSPVSWAAIAGVLLADLGICAVGVLLSAMAAAGRARELLLPLLFLPLALPIVVGGVGASVVADPGRYLAFLALYDAIFTLLAWASFEYVVTE